MAEINRFSSLRERLDHAFLAERLRGAKSYKRIAGYFRSSIFELVGEEIADIPHVRIVCNSELDAADVTVSKHVRETALKEMGSDARLVRLTRDVTYFIVVGELALEGANSTEE